MVIPVLPGRADQRFIARPDADTCGACPLLALCPMCPKGNQRTPAFYFDYHTYQVAQKRQKVATFGQSGNLRAAVEATVRSVKHPFRQGKVLVRGLFRVSCVVLSSALMVNARRLYKLTMEKRSDFDSADSDVSNSTRFTPFPPFSALFTRLPGRSFFRSLKARFAKRRLHLIAAGI